jgi:hypothetical protein
LEGLSAGDGFSTGKGDENGFQITGSLFLLSG